MQATAIHSPFLLRLRRALIEDLEPELLLALKVATFQAAGHRRSEIARLVDASAPALRVAEARVKRAVLRLDQGDSQERSA
jgi:2-keto-4-pentenoate hydratase